MLLAELRGAICPSVAYSDVDEQSLQALTVTQSQVTPDTHHDSIAQPPMALTMTLQPSYPLTLTVTQEDLVSFRCHWALHHQAVSFVGSLVHHCNRQTNVYGILLFWILLQA